MIYCQTCLPVTKWHKWSPIQRILRHTSPHVNPTECQQTKQTHITHTRIRETFPVLPLARATRSHHVGSGCRRESGEKNRVKRRPCSLAGKVTEPGELKQQTEQSLISSHIFHFHLILQFLFLFFSFWWQLIHAFQRHILAKHQDLQLAKVSTYPSARSEEESKQTQLNPFPSSLSHHIPSRA